MSGPPGRTTRKSLTQGLNRLNENMVTMAELSELAIRKALGILHLGGSAAELHDMDGNPAEVFTLDQELFGLYREIEMTCINLIALHAPVASDLRTITSSLEVTMHLDRIGRYARDTAEAAQIIHDKIPNPAERFPKIGRMAEVTLQMVNTSVRAFVQRDAEPVRNVIRDDDAVDALYDEVLKEIVSRMVDRSVSPRNGAQVILVNRYLERIADHAVDIGLQTTYLLTGERPAKPTFHVPPIMPDELAGTPGPGPAPPQSREV